MAANNVETYGTYKAWQIKDGTWFINFMSGRQYMYLLEGTEKALLIDTGYGAGNLRAFVETLTHKPIMVVNTHFHRDHAAGNGEFEEVFVHPNWAVDAEEWVHLQLPFDLNSLPYPNYKKTTLQDGQLIDLGNRIIEVMTAKPAHCNSSLFFLDRTERLLFSGDELESAQVLMYLRTDSGEQWNTFRNRLKMLKENTLRLKTRESEFDLLLPNHNGSPIAKSHMDDFIGLVDAIVAGTAVVEDSIGHPIIEKTPLGASLCRVSFKKASIFAYKKDIPEVFGQG